jgi:DMSO/TMAO reductase YedYZ molybdopterin-dependent catalytic subunit
MVTRGFTHRPQRDDLAGRIPPGQHLVDGFPVLSAGPTPRIAPEKWAFILKVGTRPVMTWNWAEFNALPQTKMTRDIHCVTTWSKLATSFAGVSLDVFLEVAKPLPSATHIMATSTTGYKTNLPIADITDGKAWIAWSHEGKPLSVEHGGPVRLLVPHLYFWKSAKWVTQITFMDHDEPGFWERNGYHDRGDPWLEQRYQGD